MKHPHHGFVAYMTIVLAALTYRPIPKVHREIRHQPYERLFHKASKKKRGKGKR